MAPRPKAPLVLGIVGAAVILAATGTASATGGGAVRFTSLPTQVFEGQQVTITAAVAPSGKNCVLTIRYGDVKTDRRPVLAHGGRAAWTLRVPNVPPDTASLTASCPGVGRAAGTMAIKWAEEPPKIVVTRRGFTQRMPSANSVATSSQVSYGLALVNERTRSDASNVSVLVNFVDAQNVVLGSARTGVGRLPASSTYYVGGQASLPTKTQVARLEIVISATSVANETEPPPLISDVVISPNSYEPYVGTVSGQLLNHYHLSMQFGSIGVVILDAAGHIIGGGSSSADGPLSLGAREFFSAEGTFNAIPVGNAASALVSVVPTYPPPTQTAFGSSTP